MPPKRSAPSAAPSRVSITKRRVIVESSDDDAEDPIQHDSEEMSEEPDDPIQVDWQWQCFYPHWCSCYICERRTVVDVPCSPDCYCLANTFY